MYPPDSFFSHRHPRGDSNSGIFAACKGGVMYKTVSSEQQPEMPKNLRR